MKYHLVSGPVTIRTKAGCAGTGEDANYDRLYAIIAAVIVSKYGLLSILMRF